MKRAQCFMSLLCENTLSYDIVCKNGQLGLGLHIVQQLLQKQGGEVTAHIHDDIFVLTLLFYKKNKI